MRTLTIFFIGLIIGIVFTNAITGNKWNCDNKNEVVAANNYCYDLKLIYQVG